MARRSISGARTIVTGASSGIGRAIVLELARRKARILATARRADRLAELGDEMKSLGADYEFLAGDVTDADHRQQLIETVRSRFGGLDILLNNAGITSIGLLSEVEEQRVRRVFEVNFFAPVETIRAALPLLRQGTNPLIVNVSSVLGHRGVPKKSVYCASKFALHGFSDALRAELVGEKIDVLLVSPATTRTEIFDVADGDASQLKWMKLGSVSARYVARRAVRAMRRGRHEIILTPGGKALVWADRLCPPIVNRLVAKFG